MVRCADCGCLSGTDPNTKELVEIDIFLRAKWETIANGKQVVQKTPICCKRIIDFQGKLGNQPDGSVHEAAVVKIIHDDIGDCEGFEPYHQGNSPTKILDMIDQRENQRFQDEQREKERQWQHEQKIKDREWQEEQRRRELAWQESVRNDDRAYRRFEKIWDRVWGLALLAAGAIISWLVQNFLKK